MQGCSGNVLWSLSLQYDTGHNNSIPATPADLGTSSFAGKEVWALWDLFPGWLVSFFFLSLPIAVYDNTFEEKVVSCARANECGWACRTCIASLLRITSIGDMKHEDFPCITPCPGAKVSSHFPSMFQD